MTNRHDWRQMLGLSRLWSPQLFLGESAPPAIAQTFSIWQCSLSAYLITTPAIASPVPRCLQNASMTLSLMVRGALPPPVAWQ